MIKKIKNKSIFYLNKLMLNLFRLLPIKDKLIVLESEGDFSDNAEALFNYLKNNGYLSNYKVIWLVNEPTNFNNINNVKFVRKKYDTVWIGLTYVLARCKYYIYDHNNFLYYLKVKKKHGQHVIYMSHGTAFKDNKHRDSTSTEYFDKMIVLGPKSAEINCHFWGCSIDKALNLGEPREDYFYSSLDEVNVKLNSIYGLEKFKKKILWMPTFRQSKDTSISENYIKNETGLPIINTYKQLIELNSILEKMDACLLLKVHHLQADLPVFEEKLSNVLVIKDDDLISKGIQLYQFIPLTDALITDYSSISVDYLLLNKPIIYTLDDYEEYKKSRGIYPPNALDYMPGPHVKNIDELTKSIRDVSNGIDAYAEKRRNIVNEFYTYQDGCASERILKYCGIVKE